MFIPPSMRGLEYASSVYPCQQEEQKQCADVITSAWCTCEQEEQQQGTNIISSSQHFIHLLETVLMSHGVSALCLTLHNINQARLCDMKI